MMGRRRTEGAAPCATIVRLALLVGSTAFLAVASAARAQTSAILAGARPTASAASGSVGVRVGRHPGFVRLVFDLPAGAEPRVVQSAGAVTVRVVSADGATVPFSALPARWAGGGTDLAERAALHVVDGGVRVEIGPAAALRESRLVGKLVLDILEPGVTARILAKPALETRRGPFDAASREVRRLPTSPVIMTATEPTAPIRIRPAVAVSPLGVPDRPAVASPEPPAAIPPVAMSPIAISPVAMSPGAMSPVAMSPVAMSPVAMSPVAMSPVAMSPVAMSPVAMSPVAMSPVAMSPGAMSPGAMSPGAMSPGAMSPGATPGAAMGAAPEPAPLPPPPRNGDAARPALLPISPRAGVAALRRGGVAILVADSADTADPAADAAWRAILALADAEIDHLPSATVVRFKLVEGMAPELDHDAKGWTLAIGAVPHVVLPAVPPAMPLAVPAAGVSVADGEGPGADIGLSAEPPHLLLAATGASRVISVADPLGGGVLLVGTLLADARPARVRAARVLPALAVLPTWRGVAVEPLSDVVDMRSLAKGFLLDVGALHACVGRLPDPAQAGSDAVELSRRFDFPPLPVGALINRQEAAAGAVAAAPARGRGAAQVRLAETMLALGLGPEAQAILRLAISADGRLANDPKTLALAGVAALLAGRPAESAGLDMPAVLDDPAGGDEVALWRTLRAAALTSAAGGEPSPDMARAIAARQAIVLAYPVPLRQRLLPLMAEVLAQAGQPLAAERLVALAGDTAGLDYARALLDLRAGRADAALERLDRLATSADRRERVRAAARAVEARLAAGKLTPAQAADALDKLIAAWRGDDRELALRLRVAELRVAAGQFRAALALLRDSEEVARGGPWSPARRQSVHERMTATFAKTLAQDDIAPMEPLQLVSLIEDNADLLPTGPDGERLATRVADRLAALDLPERAAAALRRLVDGAPPGVGRAALGARLAAMQLDASDAAAALATLSQSTAESLPSALVAARTLTYARATAARGNVDAAVGALAALATPAGDALRAELLEKAGRWSDAAAALSGLLAAALPPEGVMGKEAGALAVRLASAATQANAAGLLEQVRVEDLPRMPPGADADLVRLLTEGPIRNVSDLPRAAQEAALARAVIR